MGMSLCDISETPSHCEKPLRIISICPWQARRHAYLWSKLTHFWWEIHPISWIGSDFVYTLAFAVHTINKNYLFVIFHSYNTDPMSRRIDTFIDEVSRVWSPALPIGWSLTRYPVTLSKYSMKTNMWLKLSAWIQSVYLSTFPGHGNYMVWQTRSLDKWMKS